MTSDRFRIDARDGQARAGVLLCAHGEVETPAFVPLATSATVKGLDSAEVEALGFQMVLGNTFHLFIQPGHELIDALGGLHEFMAWRRPIITDSGGFQVFSMGHGSVAEEIKGSRTNERKSRILEISEEGVRFRSYIDGDEKFMGPETSMEIQAALGSDVALAFDECTPFHVDRDYTARSTERTHRWLDRCVDWHERHAPPGQMLYGIVQGGVYEDLRIASARADRERAGARRGGRRLARAGEGADARGGGVGAQAGARGEAAPPARDRRRGRHPRERCRRDRHLRLRNPDPARPPRNRARARPGCTLAARPRQVALARQQGAARRRAAPAWPAATGTTRAPTSTT